MPSGASRSPKLQVQGQSTSDFSAEDSPASMPSAGRRQQVAESLLSRSSRCEPHAQQPYCARHVSALPGSPQALGASPQQSSGGAHCWWGALGLGKGGCPVRPAFLLLAAFWQPQGTWQTQASLLLLLLLFRMPHLWVSVAALVLEKWAGGWCRCRGCASLTGAGRGATAGLPRLAV